MFTIDEAEVLRVVQSRRARRLLLLLPDGLVAEAGRIARCLEANAGVEVLVQADYHWGGCDVPRDGDDGLGVDLVLSFGHTQYIKKGVDRVVFIPIDTALSLREKALPGILSEVLSPGIERVAVAWSTEFASFAEPVCRWLAARAQLVTPPGDGLVSPGQVLGCHYHGLGRCEPPPDAVLLVADAFHALGALLHVGGPVYWLHPFEAKLRRIDEMREQMLSERRAAIENARGARRFGVLVERHAGQSRVAAALRLKRTLEGMGRSALLLAVSEVTSAKLQRFVDIDAFVNTACPRIESRPEEGLHIIDMQEAAVLCGLSRFEDIYPCCKGERPAAGERGQRHELCA